MTLSKTEQKDLIAKITKLYPTTTKLKRGTRKLAAWMWVNQPHGKEGKDHDFWISKLQTYVLMVNMLKQQGVTEDEAMVYGKKDVLEDYEQEFSISYPHLYKIES